MRRVIIHRKKRLPSMVTNGSRLIREYLREGRPGAFGKIGGTEGKVISLRSPWWSKYLHLNRYRRYRRELYLKSGVFPETHNQFKEFLDKFIDHTLPKMDGLACWRGISDYHARNEFAHESLLFDWDTLSTHALDDAGSWLGCLGDKRVLVISSFKHTITQQTKVIKKVWPNHPHMHSLQDVSLLACPMYAHLSPPEDTSWTIALDRMKRELSTHDFDVCLIAAGAWSLPLAVHAKALGKIGIHLGGTLQLLFGISGNRFDNHGSIERFRNEYWCYPLLEDTPPNFEGTEDAAYWKKKTD